MGSQGRGTPRKFLIEHNNIKSFLREDSFSILHIIGGTRQEDLGYLQENGFSEGEISETDTYRFNHQVALHSLVVLTNRCNMDCDYCYTEANRHLDIAEMKGDEWKKILDNIQIPHSRKIQNVSFTGGEPTCHPDFLDILKHVSGKYKVEVSTNGLNLEGPLLDTLENFEGLMGVNISIDSCNQEEDEASKGVHTFKRRLSNLEKLCEREIPTCIGMVVSGLTINSVKDTTRYFLDKHPKLRIKYIPLSRIGKAVNLDEERFLTEEDAEKYVRDVQEMVRVYGERVLTDPSSQEEVIPQNFKWSGRCSHMKYESERTLFKPRTQNEPLLIPERCNAAYGVTSISPCGELRPCLRADSFFQEVLNKGARSKLMPSLVGLSFEEIGNLPFWEIVQKSKCGFNPLETCALKYKYGRENGSE